MRIDLETFEALFASVGVVAREDARGAETRHRGPRIVFETFAAS